MQNLGALCHFTAYMRLICYIKNLCTNYMQLVCIYVHSMQNFYCIHRWHEYVMHRGIENFTMLCFEKSKKIQKSVNFLLFN